MKTHDEMIQAWMQDPAFVREYDALEQEFALFDELLRARLQIKMARVPARRSKTDSRRRQA
jgi:hypothetical protein